MWSICKTLKGFEINRHFPQELLLNRSKNFRPTLSTVHTHPVAGFQAHGGIYAPNHCWNAQLTGNNGGVAERRAQVGDDGCSAREEGRPADVGQLLVTRISPDFGTIAGNNADKYVDTDT
jgi:hypothetical protein